MSEIRKTKLDPATKSEFWFWARIIGNDSREAKGCKFADAFTWARNESRFADVEIYIGADLKKAADGKLFLTVKQGSGLSIWIEKDLDGYYTLCEEIDVPDNPFRTARSYAPGGYVEAVGVQDRLEKVRDFTGNQLRAALEVQGLQKTVRQAIDRRLRKLQQFV